MSAEILGANPLTE